MDTGNSKEAASAVGWNLRSILKPLFPISFVHAASAARLVAIAAASTSEASRIASKSSRGRTSSSEYRLRRLGLLIGRWPNKGRKYNAIKDRGTPNEAKCSSERNFCSNCSTMLWLWDHHWPELIHPFASAIDTDLPVPDEMVCVLANSKPAWVRWPEGKKSVHDVYGDDSIEGWHKKHGLFQE